MSDWEVIEDHQAPKTEMPSSDWAVDQLEPNSRQPQSNEGILESTVKAPFRIGEDVIRHGYDFLKSMPGISTSPQAMQFPRIPDVKNFMNTLMQHPGHAGGQALAGIAEQGQNVFNTPHDIANYATNRLNLLPQNINQKIQMGRMPDATNEINQTFGKPQYPGEETLRATTRNALDILGGGKAALALNPLNLTANSIAKDVLKTEKQQVASHTKRYNKIWDQADRSGFNKVPVDTNQLNKHLDVIEKYKTPREYQSLEDFINHPTLPNAQKAQSDMGIIKRGLEKKSRSGSLTSEEKSIYEAAKDSEKHIEENMFKNDKGEIHKNLKNNYNKVTRSYRENVVPYKYNRHIQAFKNKELQAEQLVNALSKGEFAAKGKNPLAMKIRKSIKPLLKGAGVAGLGGAGAAAYETMMSNPFSENH